MEIKITRHQQTALQSDILELNQLQQIRDTKLAAHARHRDTILLDAGFAPEKMNTYEIKEVGGQPMLIVTAKQES